MDAKTIRGNMTQGEWEYIPDEESMGRYEVLVHGGWFGEGVGYNVKDEDAQAICNAINNTYGANLDPIKLLEFVQAFERHFKGCDLEGSIKELINLFEQAKIK